MKGFRPKPILLDNIRFSHFILGPRGDVSGFLYQIQISTRDLTLIANHYSGENYIYQTPSRPVPNGSKIYILLKVTADSIYRFSPVAAAEGSKSPGLTFFVGIVLLYSVSKSSKVCTESFHKKTQTNCLASFNEMAILRIL